MTVRSITAILLAGALCGPVQAEDVQAEDAQAGDCRQVHPKLTFCGGEEAWRPVDRDLPTGIALFRSPARGVGKVIVETVPPGEITGKQVERAILRDLAVSQGGDDRSFTVDRLEGGTVDGTPAGNLEYSIPGGTRPLNLLHSYLVKGDLLIQFLTITAPAVEETSARALHREFLGGFEITPEAPEL
ncbi:hypothetical protein P1J78_07185 [Psychromarinibacter sp. C21-152]|uniref:Uncharacterized protein n=1 Tax=Psychromarinibacter sediminicola TaxID=3033385 RepID=A0AAE3NRX7_9RHOB|nr:hypothetical protein [Psychromarinibacter sediminicola]MDF0600509.1 hypothetical protein [Psychromarinibacter sediminicola]